MCKIGLVLEGGAYRGVFTAGVLDYLQERNITFSYVIGVSAGAGNAASFVSRQNGKVKNVVTGKSTLSHYGIRQMLHSKKLLDTDGIVQDYFYHQLPFDFKTFFASDTECEFVLTCCETGKAAYFNADGSEQRLTTLTKATCSVPILCKPVELDARNYLDGSLTDSVPIQYALQNKCDKAVVVLTRRWKEEPPTDYTWLRPILHMSYHAQYPNLMDAMMQRKETYEKQMESLSDYEHDGKAYVIQPEGMHIGHFEKDMQKVNAYYGHGKEVMERQLDRLCAFMQVS